MTYAPTVTTNDQRKRCDLGAAKSNPRSQQYTGPMPEEMCLAQIEVRLKATDEWTAANPESLEKPPDDQINVHLVVSIGRAEPSRLFPGEPQRWPRTEQGTVIGQLMVMTPGGPTPAIITLTEFRKMTPINGRTEPPTNGASSLLTSGEPPWSQ